MRLERRIVFLLLVAALVQPAMAQFGSILLCSTALNLTSNSTSIDNRLNLIRYLSANVSRTGFTTGVSVLDSDQVYGLALCLGDSSSEDCQSCVARRSTSDDASCESAIFLSDQCFGRYSSANFIGVVNTEIVSVSFDREYVSDSARFDKRKWQLLNSMTASTVSDKTGLMLAMGEVGINASHTIKGLTQCTRDISMADCSTCLANLTSYVVKHLDDKTYVDVAGGSCIMRYKLQSSNAHGTKVRRLRRNLIVLITSISVTAVALLL